MDPNFFISHTQNWIKSMVIGLQLCPFARPVWQEDRIRYMVSNATKPEELWLDFLAELEYLISTPRGETETSLLIHPKVLESFSDYLDFLASAEQGLEDGGLTGIIQVVGFHPEYQFAHTAPTDVENYTNRSPYPMLHLLREASVTEAVNDYPDVNQIPVQNIALLRKLGPDRVVKMRNDCFNKSNFDKK